VVHFAPALYSKNGKWDTEMPNAKIFGVRLRAGDAYLMQSGGGGGFGDPLERDPARVAHDVKEGYVSAEAARDDYGVITSTEGILDERATEILRRRMRGGAAEGDAFEVIAG
jgi:N-methylhydantoinase B